MGIQHIDHAPFNLGEDDPVPGEGFESIGIYLCLFCILSVLAVSTWSGILLWQGSIASGGPIGFVMNFFISAGLL